MTNSFHSYDLDKVKFEFGIATVTGAGYHGETVKNFVRIFNENSPKNYPYTYPLNSPSGSETENLSPNEVLMVVTLDYQSLVFESLWFPIISAIVFTLLIMAAFYLDCQHHAKAEKAKRDKK